jgi:hypothetical protein
VSNEELTWCGGPTRSSRKTAYLSPALIEETLSGGV